MEGARVGWEIAPSNRNLKKCFFYPFLKEFWSCSVRVSNELGAGNPKTAKLSIVVNVLSSGVLGVIFAAIIVATKNQFPVVFTDSPQVMRKTSELGYLLAATIFLNSIQPVGLPSSCKVGSNKQDCWCWNGYPFEQTISSRQIVGCY
jgi:hypothetical protein